MQQQHHQQQKSEHASFFCFSSVAIFSQSGVSEMERTVLYNIAT
jgi:hypothetical protein